MKFRSVLSVPFLAGVFAGVLVTTAAADMLGSAVFPDVQLGAYYDGAIGRLYGAGVVKGGPDGKFHPGDFVTRADVAVMIDRAINGGEVVTHSSSSSRSSSSVASSSSVSSSSSTSTSSSSSSVSSVANIGEAGAFRFSTSTVSLPESVASVSLSVQRYGGTKGNALVSYATADGTAKAGVRYNQASGQVAFGDGETSKTITLKFINNLIADPNEVFTVTLTNPTGGAVIGTPATVNVTVLDNDGGGGNTTTTSSSSSSSSTSGNSSAAGGVITFSAWAYSYPENQGLLTVNVLRKGNSSAAVNVDYSTTPGSATVGTHYNATSGTLNFAAGETSKSFTIQMLDNNTIDGNKNFTVKLTNATGGASLDTPNSVQVTVVDNEANSGGTGSILFSDSTYTITKSTKSAVVTVYRRTGFMGTATVNYATSDSTAVGNVDYTPTSGTLTFAPGESTKSFSIPITVGTFSGEKRINLTLSSPTGQVVLGSQPTAVVSILGQ